MSNKTKKICSIDGCNNIHFGKGYCNKHYSRFRKNGSPYIVKKEKHGMAHSSEYSSWQHMKQRCFNENFKHYYNYGGRGITVCDRWLHSFNNFYKDMGSKPTPKHQIDRINNDGNYEPGNCRWVTALENMRSNTHTLLTIDKAREIRELSKTMTNIDLAKKYNVSSETISAVILNKTWKEQEV